MREFLPLLVNYKTSELVESAQIEDVGQYIHTADGYTALTFVVDGVELEDIQDIRGLEDTTREQILGFFVVNIVNL